MNIELDDHQLEVIRKYQLMMDNIADYEFDDLRDHAVLMANFVSAKVRTVDFLDGVRKDIRENIEHA